ncbi:hypothetical protein HanLR1_Chr01g0003601 [Helianthus annuus]|nr:hypothetical protein HanHA89_Chr01g0004261 [Helianthus annuus]KAJ0782041.1 hypothetical protein HanLR1_Chr01g0003601 [Helianthus annuus]
MNGLLRMDLMSIRTDGLHPYECTFSSQNLVRFHTLLYNIQHMLYLAYWHSGGHMKYAPTTCHLYIASQFTFPAQNSETLIFQPPSSLFQSVKQIRW